MAPVINVPAYLNNGVPWKPFAARPLNDALIQLRETKWPQRSYRDSGNECRDVLSGSYTIGTGGGSENDVLVASSFSSCTGVAEVNPDFRSSYRPDCRETFTNPGTHVSTDCFYSAHAR